MRRSSWILPGLLLGVALLLVPLAAAVSPGGSVPVTPPATLAVKEEETPPPVADPAVILAVPAADACTAAPDLVLRYDDILEIGAITDVSSFGIESSDPNLAACMFGTPPSSKGYRSAWYRLVPPVGGRLVVRAASNSDYRRNYDTTIAIFRDDALVQTNGSCTDLTLLSCNDDAHGLLSEADARVEAGQAYYIEVVDRSLATPGQVLLNLEIQIIPDAPWEGSGAPLPEPRTRHAVVISDTVAFVLGGETVLGGAPRRTGRIWRYDTVSGVWTPLGTHLAGATTNGEGYANTDAILLGDEIHYVSGGTGAASQYDPQHWVYSIPNDTWHSIQALGGPTLDWESITGSSAKGLGYSELVRYQSGTQTGFYLVGGLAGRFLAADPTEVEASTAFHRFLDTGSDQVWQELEPLSRPRYAHTAVNVGSLVCVVGGLTTQLTAENTLENALITDGECYNPVSRSWQQNVGVLNTPRYLAGSAVGPDGRWYVYGGINQNGNYVATVEVHDFATASWEEMPLNFNIENPAMAWLRGDFVGDTLWLFGGEQIGPTRPVPVSQIQSKRFPPPVVELPFPTGVAHLPFVGRAGMVATGESPQTAVFLPIGGIVEGNFIGVGDVYDVYAFDWPGGTLLTTLSNIPLGSDYDLLLYAFNKNYINGSQQIGSNDEQLSGPLLPGRYYLFVTRTAPPAGVAPSSQPYRLQVVQN